MNGFFSGDRNKAFVFGLVTLVASVYLKDRLPLTDDQIANYAKAFAELTGFWIVGRSIRKPEVAK